ncbi:hypothetical protein CHU92_10570 [Flavobacterium cyanobacteriorum]|uniref:Uncharacterized protein n=1 Tax=Flavobacterium cyanobacteriorum TaxID=2022802 RepID=A0A255Z2P4_9FLAO|nr:hypothetical protein [Flavobacterium cyanobacteriorum]OYQ35709.1 hypothetical protein CHU92_10570 [Flavobacterium cyanobacteriorum]
MKAAIVTLFAILSAIACKSKSPQQEYSFDNVQSISLDAHYAPNTMIMHDTVIITDYKILNDTINQ